MIQKEGVNHYDPAYLFDEGSTISWIPCGRKLTCSYPGIKFAYGPDTYFGNEVRGRGHPRSSTGSSQAFCSHPVPLSRVLHMQMRSLRSGGMGRGVCQGHAPSLLHYASCCFSFRCPSWRWTAQFDKLEELIYVESHLSNTSTKFYGEVTQQMLKNADFPGSNNGTGLFQTMVGLKLREVYERIIAKTGAAVTA